jgi:hypothetical protein
MNSMTLRQILVVSVSMVTLVSQWRHSLAFLEIRRRLNGIRMNNVDYQKISAVDTVSIAKQNLLESLEDPNGFNIATPERTKLVEELTKANPTPKPASTDGFAPFAVGTWRIVYAPHISTMGSLAGGSFDPVYYIMKPNGVMTSHARFSFPLLGSGWLSVSGTYGSEDDDSVCYVDFNKAWVSRNISDDDSPLASLEDVPNSLSKSIIQTLGQLGFVRAISVFPVSYLDDDTIVFNFDLLGTRICARKIDPTHFCRRT